LTEAFLRITIWDHDAQRIAVLDRLIWQSAKKLGLKVSVNSVSEPPALARERLMGRAPALEIAGRFWSLKAGGVPGADALEALLERFSRLDAPARL